MLETLLSMGGLSLLFTSFNTWSASLNLVFFSLTWAILLLSHPPLRIELIGTAAVRILCFWLPSILFLLFDSAIPSLSANIKLQRNRAVPTTKPDLKRRAKVVVIAAGNMALGLVLQGGIEYLLVYILRRKSMLRIVSTLPFPSELLWGVIRSLFLREAIAYYIHRYVLHDPKLRLAKYHKCWQHSIDAPWSIVAHYDHPLSYLLLRWIPVMVPAILFRLHLLTFYLFLAAASVEECMTFSGYSVVYSMLGGATRRTDKHFRMGGKGNYAPWGVLDWIHGTTIGSNVKEDTELAVDRHEERKGRRKLRSRRRRQSDDDY